MIHVVPLEGLNIPNQAIFGLLLLIVVPILLLIAAGIFALIGGGMCGYSFTL